MNEMIRNISVHLLNEKLYGKINLKSDISTDGLTFAFYLMKGRERLDTVWYSKDDDVFFDLSGLKGQFSVLGFVKRDGADPDRMQSNRVSIDADFVQKRSIRLKEWPPLSSFSKVPSSTYLDNTSELEAIEYRVTTDSNGFLRARSDRFKECEDKWVFLGGSFIESLFVREGFRFNDILENQLSRNGKSIDILNGGYSGATLLHIVNTVINKVIPLKPKKLFVCVPSNDSRCLRQQGGYYTKDKFFSPVVPTLGGAERKSAINVSDLPLMLNILKTAAECSGIRLYIGTTPSRHINFDSDELLVKRYSNRKYFDSIIKDRFAVSDVVRTWTESNDIELIDLEKEMLDFKKYSYDELHLNEFGSNQLANILLSRMA